MPLCINGRVIDRLPPDTQTLFHVYPSLKEYSRQLLTQPHKTVSPIGSLCVIQREFAVVTPNDQNISVFGTTDATTCNIVVLRHSGSGVTGLGHFDGSGVEKGIQDMFFKVRDYSPIDGEFELHMVGGFDENREGSEKKYSNELTLSILYCFHRLRENIHLITACVCELNNFKRNNINLPVIHGLAVNVKTGNIYPADFSDKGPDFALRSSRLFSPGSPEMANIYDTYNGVVTIGPFCYQPVRCIDDWLQLGDDLILKFLSTSPEAEGPDYVREVKQALQFIRDNPFPSVTVFPRNMPIYYRKNEYGMWCKLESEPEESQKPSPAITPSPPFALQRANW